MARIHNISRQTLIYYDKIGLFKPVRTDSGGIRLYELRQIPLLREICFLKSIGVSLREIGDHLPARDPRSIAALLTRQRDRLDQETRALQHKQKDIRERIELYTSAAENISGSPMRMRRFPARRIAFFPLERPQDADALRLNMTKAWRALSQSGIPPAGGCGTILMRESVLAGDPLAGAGTYVNLPGSFDKTQNAAADLRTLPAGEYACRYKHAALCETGDDLELLAWIGQNSYRPAGNIVNACLLDAAIYRENSRTDFCELQIPVKKIGKNDE